MNMERRAHFRVDMIDTLEALARIISINENEAPVQKLIPIVIRDLSGGGMKIHTELDLPIQAKIVLQISFQFENEYFDVKALILRKVDLDKKLKEYGLKFLEVSPGEQNRLVRSLNHYKIKQVKDKKSQVDLRKQRGIGPLVKMLDALEEPAYLVTSQRVVVAANQAALAQGAHLGERCYQTICQNKRVCSFCRIEEAQGVDSIIRTSGMLQDEARMFHWLYLENSLYLHYLKKAKDA